jgi:uncharacterized protein (TIGR02147 family)
MTSIITMYRKAFMSEPIASPNIFGYSDFRAYLADFQKARQKTESRFTKSEFSRQLGLPQTRSYFFDVLRGKRVTGSFVERFISVMMLKIEEAQYFRTLVMFNQAETPEERDLYFDHLIRLNRTPKRIMDSSTFDYYRQWHHGVIRALLAIYDFRGDFLALGKAVVPPLSVRTVKASITLLKKLNLIAPDSRGILKPTDQAIVAPDHFKDDLIRKLQSSLIDRARVALIEKRPQQVIATNTLSISRPGAERIRKHIEKFRSELRAIIHKDENRPEQVFQFIVGFFPASNPKEKV